MYKAASLRTQNLVFFRTGRASIVNWKKTDSLLAIRWFLDGSSVVTYQTGALVALLCTIGGALRM